MTLPTAIRAGSPTNLSRPGSAPTENAAFSFQDGTFLELVDELRASQVIFGRPLESPMSGLGKEKVEIDAATADTSQRMCPGAIQVRPPRPLVYSLSHICTRHFQAEMAGRVMRLSAPAAPIPGHPVPVRRGGGMRRPVSTFSKSSQRRLLQTLLAIEWEQMAADGLLWIGLTYPGDSGCVPQDGDAAKRHLRAFRAKWERCFGKAVGVWKMEFQRRGAPHFHLLLAKPAGVDIKDMREWVARSWWEVVGSGDPDHLQAGTSAAVWDDAGIPIGYISGYSESDPTAKAYQHKVPDGFEKPGRWWGCWNLKPDWRKVELSPAEWYQLRRNLRKLYESRCGKRKRGGRGFHTGLWVTTRTSDPASIIARLLGRDLFADRRADHRPHDDLRTSDPEHRSPHHPPPERPTTN